MVERKQILNEGSVESNSFINEGPAWERLHNANTVSRLRKNRVYEKVTKGRQVINDSLDLALNATYEHDKEFWSSRAQSLRQPRTRMETMKQTLQSELRNATRNENRFDKTLNVETPHQEVSSRGFSRKPDGSFYIVTPQRTE